MPRLISDWADAQADLSLRWAHSHFVGFVMSRLKCIIVMVHVQLISREKVCHFIDTHRDMHDVISHYLALLCYNFNLKMATLETVLLTLTKTEALEGKWQKSAHQFKCGGLLKSTCSLNVNSAISAMCNLKMAKLATILLTTTITEASDGKWQKSAHQFKCSGLLKSTCILNVNGAIIAMLI